MWLPLGSTGSQHCLHFWFYSINILVLLCLVILLVYQERTHYQAVYNPECNCYQDAHLVNNAPAQTWFASFGAGLSKAEMQSLGRVLAKDDGATKAESSRFFPSKKIIIYTMFRSGSSFLADIFAHQPGVYYMFEPLQTYPPPVTANDTAAKLRKAKHIAERGAHYLRQLLSCNLVQFIRDVIAFSTDGYHRVATWGRRVFCRDYQDGLSLPRSCNPLRLDKISRRCNDYQTILIKEVVLHNLTALIPLMEQGVKVIHLLRDPRGQINSIRHLPGGKKRTTSEWVDAICTILKQDVEATRHIQSLPDHIRNNYRRIRYEDLATEPFRVIDELFAFTGLAMHRNVRKWLTEATTTRKRSTWSTMRMSNETAVAWRERLKFYIVHWVQERCWETMGPLGYVNVSTVEELGDVSKSLVQPMRSMTPLWKINHVFKGYPL